jgi:hypothetical protein
VTAFGSDIQPAECPGLVGSGHRKSVPIELCPVDAFQAYVPAEAAGVAIELNSNGTEGHVPDPCHEPCYPARSMAYPLTVARGWAGRNASSLTRASRPTPGCTRRRGRQPFSRWQRHYCWTRPGLSNRRLEPARAYQTRYERMCNSSGEMPRPVAASIREGRWFRQVNKSCRMLPGALKAESAARVIKDAAEWAGLDPGRLLGRSRRPSGDSVVLKAGPVAAPAFPYGVGLGGLFMKISASCGRCAPHGSAIRAARRLGQSADKRRSRSGIGMSPPCSCIRRATVAVPRRGQKLQPMLIVARCGATSPSKMEPLEGIIGASWLVPCAVRAAFDSGAPLRVTTLSHFGGCAA